MNYRIFSLVLILVIFSVITFGQTIENPFKISEETFSELNLNNDETVDDKEGNQYKIVNTRLEKGLLINHKGEWKKHGKYFRYTLGKVHLETTYKYDLNDGKEIKFFPDGQKNWEYEYSGGLKNGSYAILYQKNGQEYQTGRYKNDVKVGEEITYYENGNKKQVKTYRNGKVIRAAQYNSEGTKISDNTYN